MKTDNTAARRQVRKIKESQPELSTRRIAAMTGISKATVSRWLRGPEPAPEAVEPEPEATETNYRERVQQMLRDSPTGKIQTLRDFFTEKQYEVIQRQVRDLEVLRAKQLKAVMDNDSMTTRAIAAATTATLKAQASERLIYNIQPGTEHQILSKGMNDANFTDNVN